MSIGTTNPSMNEEIQVQLTNSDTSIQTIAPLITEKEKNAQISSQVVRNILWTNTYLSLYQQSMNSVAMNFINKLKRNILGRKNDPKSPENILNPNLTRTEDDYIELQTVREKINETQMSDLQKTLADPEISLQGRAKLGSFLRRLLTDKFLEHSDDSKVRSKTLQAPLLIPERDIRTATENWRRTRVAVLTALRFQHNRTNSFKNYARKLQSTLSYINPVRPLLSPKNLDRRKFNVTINPHGWKKWIWDLVISILLLYYAFIVPYRFAFMIYGNKWIYVDLAFDMVFAIDIVVKFLVGREVHGVVMYDPGFIARAYLGSTFLLDLICILPVYLIYEELAIIKLLRFFHVQRLLSVVKQFVQRALSLYLQGGINLKLYDFLFTTYRIGLFFSLASHVINCMWIWAGLVAYNRNYDSWLENLMKEEQDQLTIYIDGLYFIVTSVSTVGFGDIVPKNPYEMLFACITKIFGIGMMAYLQSNIIYAARKFQSYAERIYEKKDKLDQWLFEREVGHESEQLDRQFVKDIKIFFLFYWLNDIKTMLSNRRYYLELTPPLRASFSRHFFGRLFYNFSCFFRSIEDEGFFFELLVKLQPKAFVYDDIVIKKGFKPSRFYLILDGTLNILNEHGRAILQLSKHTYIGDDLLLDRKSTMSCVVSSTFLHCLYIDQRSFLSLCEQYPNTKRNLQNMAKLRHRNFLLTSRSSRWRAPVNRVQMLNMQKRIKTALSKRSESIAELRDSIENSPKLQHYNINSESGGSSLLNSPIKAQADIEWPNIEEERKEHSDLACGDTTIDVSSSVDSGRFSSEYDKSKIKLDSSKDPRRLPIVSLLDNLKNTQRKHSEEASENRSQAPVDDNKITQHSLQKKVQIAHINLEEASKKSDSPKARSVDSAKNQLDPEFEQEESKKLGIQLSFSKRKSARMQDQEAIFLETPEYQHYSSYVHERTRDHRTLSQALVDSDGNMASDNSEEDSSGESENLNRSLEEPVDSFVPNFDPKDSCLDEITEHLNSRLHTIYYKLDRFRNEIRNDVHSARRNLRSIGNISSSIHFSSFSIQ